MPNLKRIVLSIILVALVFWLCCSDVYAGGGGGGSSSTQGATDTGTCPCKIDYVGITPISNGGSLKVIVNVRVSSVNSQQCTNPKLNITGTFTVDGKTFTSKKIGQQITVDQNSEITLNGWADGRASFDPSSYKGKTINGKVTVRFSNPLQCGNVKEERPFVFTISDDGKITLTPMLLPNPEILKENPESGLFTVGKLFTGIGYICCFGATGYGPFTSWIKQLKENLKNRGEKATEEQLINRLLNLNCDNENVLKANGWSKEDCLTAKEYAERAKEYKEKYEKRCGPKEKWYSGLKGSVHMITCIISIGYSVSEGILLASHSGSCHPEQPLPGTEHCEACNAYGLCLKERCEVLGHCKFVPFEDKTGGLCLPDVCEPTAVPVIEDISTRWFVDRAREITDDLDISTSSKAGGVQVVVSYDGTDVDPEGALPFGVSDVEITLKLNQGARCRYAIDQPGLNFSEMPYEFDNAYLYPKEQTARIDLTSLTPGMNHTIYIKCQGICGQAHEATFDWNYVTFTKSNKPDELPPEVMYVVPDGYRQYISSTAKKQTIKFYFDESLDECRISTIANNLTEEWGEMNSEQSPPECVTQFTCTNNQPCYVRTPEGYVTESERHDCGMCEVTVKLTPECKDKVYTVIDWDNLTSMLESASETNETIARMLERFSYTERMQQLGLTGQSKIVQLMLKCEDTHYNRMQEAYAYMISTYPPYNMSIVLPENGYDTFDRQILINVTTTRAAECRYSLNEQKIWEEMTPISEGFDVVHVGMTEWLEPGDYTLYVKCRDIGGLEVGDSVQFKIKPDNTPPTIIRMFARSNNLVIETDEQSTCYFNIDDEVGCNFNVDDVESFSTVNGYTHIAPLNDDWTYYVKCKDRFDNMPAGCTAVIRAAQLPRG